MPEKYGHQTKDSSPAEDQSTWLFCFPWWNLRISLCGHVRGLWTHSGCTILVTPDRYRYWRKGSFMATPTGSLLNVSHAFGSYSSSSSSSSSIPCERSVVA